MGKATKGSTARKQTKTAGREKNKLVKENASASNEPINRMIMAISEIGHVSLSPLIIIVML